MVGGYFIEYSFFLNQNPFTLLHVSFSICKFVHLGVIIVLKVADASCGVWKCLVVCMLCNWNLRLWI